MGKRIKIIETEWGIANNFGNFIEIHKDLKKYPKLRKAILTHEKTHTESVWSWKDFKLDYFTSAETQGIKRLDLYKFMIKRPKTWIQVLPFYYTTTKGFVIDLNKTIFWAFAIGFLTLETYLLKLII